MEDESSVIINKEMKRIVVKMYNNIFCRFRRQYINVFLCGGASTKIKKSLRDKVRTLLENETNRRSWQLPIKVFYPEDLLIEMLNKTKDADLLCYEQFLANNSHVIPIICESAGSLVELGAFTNNDYTVDKVIAAVDKKRKKDKSFIMLGPVKYLKKINKLNVIEYGSDEKEFAQKLVKNIREKYQRANMDSRLDLSTIVGMHYFIQLILYLFKKMNSQELAELIRHTLHMEETKIDDKEFNVLYNAALKLLFQDEQIIKQPAQRYSNYKLTKKGYSSMERMIANCTSGYSCDRIRIEIMYNDFYKSPHS